MKRKLNSDTSALPLKKKKTFTEPLKTEKISTSQPMFPIFPEAADLDLPGGVAITANGLQFLPRQGPSEEDILKEIFLQLIEADDKNIGFTHKRVSDSVQELNPKWTRRLFDIDSPFNCTEIPDKIRREEFEWPAADLSVTDEIYATVIEENGREVCSECHKCLLSWQMYQRKRHLRAFHKFPCPGDCGYSFVRKVDLQKHFQDFPQCKEKSDELEPSSAEKEPVKAKVKPKRKKPKVEWAPKKETPPPQKVEKVPLKPGQVYCPYCNRVCSDQDQCFRHLRTCELAKLEREKAPG